MNSVAYGRGGFIIIISIGLGSILGFGGFLAPHKALFIALEVLGATTFVGGTTFGIILWTKLEKREEKMRKPIADALDHINKNL